MRYFVSRDSEIFFHSILVEYHEYLLLYVYNIIYDEFNFAAIITNIMEIIEE